MSRRLILALATVSAVVFGGVAVAARRSPLPPADVSLPPVGVLAVTDVTVIDGTGAAPRRGNTVLVVDGVITAIGATGAIPIPESAEVVDGSGGFLIPGLWDMHEHGVLAERHGPLHKRLLVAFGVTGTRVMEEQLDEAEIGRQPEPSADLDMLGPRVVRSGRVVNGPGGVSRTALTVRDARDGVAVLDSLAVGGSDFVKVYNLVGREAYFALLREARRRSMPVGGHVPFAISVAEASDSGQASMEHLSGVLMACSGRADELRAAMLASTDGRAAARADGQFQGAYAELERLAAESWDEERCAGLARRLAANGTAVTPTLVQLRRQALATHAAELDVEYFHLVAPGWPDRLAERIARARQRPTEANARRDSTFQVQMRTVKLFADAGVDILAGTDNSVDFVVPGFGLHEELELLGRAGLDPAAVLRAATLAAAREAGVADSLGTIEVGRLADMVLLDANPLVDIYNTRRIRAVVLRGRLLDRARLRQLRAEAATLAAARTPRAEIRPGLLRTARSLLDRLRLTLAAPPTASAR